MGRYNFYDESPNKYSFLNENLGISTNASNFDTYDFYYNEEELSTPPKMDYDIIFNLQSPDDATKCEVDMSTVYSNLIAYATKLEAELDCTICNI
jgi:hypothetical protein